jgi:site-specific recombinase XerD
MKKTHLKLVTPRTVNRTVAPKRLPNAELRTREYLTEAEMERLLRAARENRWGHRDATMLLVAYRHGLRASVQREQEPKSPFVFTSERGSPFSTAGFARMVERVGEAARLGFKSHPHMLRHACGYALANKGHDTRALQAYLGHRNIQHTVRYTELSPTRFKDFWRK